MNALEKHLQNLEHKYGSIYIPQSVIRLRLLVTRLFCENLDEEIGSPRWQANLMKLAQARVDFIRARNHPSFVKKSTEENISGDLLTEINHLTPWLEFPLREIARPLLMNTGALLTTFHRYMIASWHYTDWKQLQQYEELFWLRNISSIDRDEWQTCLGIDSCQIVRDADFFREYLPITAVPPKVERNVFSGSLNYLPMTLEEDEFMRLGMDMIRAAQHVRGG